MKKFITLLVLVVTLMTSLVFARNYTDLSSTHWAYDSIIGMSEKGILSGYPDGTFMPSKSITRAEFAKILTLTLELKPSSEPTVFSDVSSSFWGYEYINAASRYLSGYTDGKTVMYLPNETAVREDVAVAVVIAAGLQEQSYDLTTLDRFTDKNEISENLKKYVALAVENNLMHGNADGTFNPKGKLTRAEVCKLMMNTVEELEKIVLENQTNNNQCTRTSVIPGHRQGYTYKYKDATKHQVYRTCEVCKTKVQISDDAHNFTYADYCGYCDYHRKSSVTLSKTKAELKVGEVLTLNATISSQSTSKTKVLTWNSSNTSVAVVNNGTITALSEGTATITAETDNGESATFTLTVKGSLNEEPVKPQTLYGDVDEDGKVDINDSVILARYIEYSNVVISDQGLKNADVNADGKINKTDVNIILKVDTGWNIALPATDYIEYGDANEDGEIEVGDALIILKYAEKYNDTQLSAQGLKNADVNEDGKVNATDAVIVLAVDSKWNIELPAKGIVIYGDVNEDGWLNENDVNNLEIYLAGETSLNTQAKKNADFNGDGKVDSIDVSSLRAYIKSQSDPSKVQILLNPGETVKPTEPEEKTIYGDVNEDGTFDIQDSVVLARYLKGTFNVVLSEQGKKNADVNVDGNINATDLLIMDRILADWDIELPAQGYVVYGDANEDGEIDVRDSLYILQYAEKVNNRQLTAQGLKNADVNADGKVNGTDALIVSAIVAGWDIDVPAKNFTAYGDAEEDGRIDQNDITAIENHISGKKILIGQAKKNADFNGDGNIDGVDVASLKAYRESTTNSYLQPLIEPGETVEERPELNYGIVELYKISRNVPYVKIKGKEYMVRTLDVEYYDSNEKIMTLLDSFVFFDRYTTDIVIKTHYTTDILVQGARVEEIEEELITLSGSYSGTYDLESENLDKKLSEYIFVKAEVYKNAKGAVVFDTDIDELEYSDVARYISKGDVIMVNNQHKLVLIVEGFEV